MANINSPFIVRSFWLEIKLVRPHSLLNIAHYISVVNLENPYSDNSSSVQIILKIEVTFLSRYFHLIVREMCVVVFCIV